MYLQEHPTPQPPQVHVHRLLPSQRYRVNLSLSSYRSGIHSRSKTPIGLLEWIALVSVQRRLHLCLWHHSGWDPPSLRNSVPLGWISYLAEYSAHIHQMSSGEPNSGWDAPVDWAPGSDRPRIVYDSLHTFTFTYSSRNDFLSRQMSYRRAGGVRCVEGRPWVAAPRESGEGKSRQP